MDYDVKTVFLKNENEKNELKSFLKRYDLNFEDNIDYSCIIKDEKDRMIATASKTKNIIKCLAIDIGYRGLGISTVLINNIIDKIFKEGYSHFFAFTLNKNSQVFESLGFSKIINTNSVSLFENGAYNIMSYLDSLIEKHSFSNNEKSALVMNCNPMTLGHLHLIDYACKNSREVLLFVVEENKSVFPFKDRLSIIKENTKDFKNLKIIESSDYIISLATFPSYFLKRLDDKIDIYTEMDLNIFGKYFCKKFNINKRYVGNEPFDQVTNKYNIAMKKILPEYGASVCEIERLELYGEVVSASKVRNLIFENKLIEAYKYLPQGTIDYLKSDNGKKIIDKIR
ncbi:MAG: [citrate (pro-3S)-lyase] ligase [Oscillospiraceae bacterium]|nr:[citrate (pro-3S)-lyase] ligase [Oscillospiraceae bacterium]